MMGLRLAFTLGPPVWNLLRASVRLVPVGRPGDHPDGCIFACLHRDILPAIMYVRAMRPVLLVSNSTDGDILVRTLGEKHYSFVRGASGEGGGRAFVRLRRLVENGRHAGLAVDGPRGPFGVVHEGVIRLAQLTGRAIVPLLACPERATSLGSWDRSIVPWPFSRVRMVIGEPRYIGRETEGAEVEEARRQLGAWFTDREVGA